MRLTDLIGTMASGLAVVQSGTDPEIQGLTADSRQVVPGCLFAAIPGHTKDGRHFMSEAAHKGARAILAPEGTSLPGEIKALSQTPALIVAADVREALAHLAAAFHGSQPDIVTAVTGTNGKTSVAEFTRQLWHGAGHVAASLGTLGVVTGAGNRQPGAMTTPDPVTLHQTLSRLSQRGVDHLCFEASSHGLDQRRLDGVRVAAAAFTNLSRDHLDYHGSMEAYMAAKARLFETLLDMDGTAILNADAPETVSLAETIAASGRHILYYGRRDGADIRLLHTVPESAGQILHLAVMGRQKKVRLPLIGGFQAENALAALGLTLPTGLAVERGLELLEDLNGIPGRLQAAGNRADGTAAFVDYAHTPDALLQVLKAVRPHVRHRLVLVFGCGGDRDPGKRSQMGRIADRDADLVVITDDNPRSEDPAAIRRDIRAACPAAVDIGNRREAIQQATASLQPGDILVVAGKGHEQGQIIGNEVHPFDDLQEVQTALNN